MAVRMEGVFRGHPTRGGGQSADRARPKADPSFEWYFSTAAPIASGCSNMTCWNLRLLRNAAVVLRTPNFVLHAPCLNNKRMSLEDP